MAGGVDTHVCEHSPWLRLMLGRGMLPYTFIILIFPYFLRVYFCILFSGAYFSVLFWLILQRVPFPVGSQRQCTHI
jgi:hypothetical protein